MTPYRISTFRLANLLCLAACLFSAARPASAATTTIETALKLVPTQSNVDYDRPTEAEVSKCTLKPVKTDDRSGWTVFDPDGRTLRQFFDTNNDNVVDLWCYYKDGIEVYRDVDTDFNRKADQCRWLNTAGQRWGLDTDEDGKIDRWKSISAQEVTAELVNALAWRDTARFSTLLLTGDELGSLGLGNEAEKQVADKLKAAKARFASLVVGQLPVTRKTRWLHFAASQPGVVPADTNGSTKDLIVYENVVAMIDTDGTQGLVQVGTLVQVGSMWKLIDAPTVANEATAAAAEGFFFQVAGANPASAIGGASGAGGDGQLQKLLADLEKLQQSVATASPAQRPGIYARQADLLEQLVEVSSEAGQKTEWLKQLADTVSAAVQANEYPEGNDRLQKLIEKLSKDEAGDELIGYVRYRQLLAGYSSSLQDPKADFAKIQEKWEKDLQEFVATYAKTSDAAEAMLQLAMAYEFGGEEDDAKKWYGKVVSDHPGSAQAKKAAGARRRLESVGKPLTFVGTLIDGGRMDLSKFAGRIVVIQYWASWCEPCKADMAVLRSLIAKHGRDFAVIGVNVDLDRDIALASIREHKLTWPNIYEPGGLDSRPAVELGVLTLPTMLLIDQRGQVVNRSVLAAELEGELKKRIR